MTNLIRVLIADDHFIVRQGLASLLVARHGMELVGEAATGREAVELARRTQPDVILMDMVMPEMDGVQAIAAIKQDNPDARILVLTSFGKEAEVARAIQAGALGYMLKDSSREQLLKTIREVAAGQFSLPLELALKLVQPDKKPPPTSPPPEILTTRELQVLKGIARGLSNQEIAAELFIVPTTVSTHARNIFTKLGLDNRTQVALYALEHGLIE
ncbi:MAG: response regulator transcription factor [Anaerolineae bacterium]